MRLDVHVYSGGAGSGLMPGPTTMLKTPKINLKAKKKNCLLWA